MEETAEVTSNYFESDLEIINGCDLTLFLDSHVGDSAESRKMVTATTFVRGPKRSECTEFYSIHDI